MNFFNRKMLKNRPKGYSPVAQSFLRGAGAFTRERVIDKALKAIFAFGALLGISIGGLIVLLIPPPFALWLIMLCCLAGCVAAAFLALFWRSGSWISNQTLGAHAEYQVAETLSRLGRPQWRIIHGFKKESGGDIDHIVVCPKGVFVIETKGLRAVNKLNLHQGKKPKLTYDGWQIYGDGGKPLPFNPVAQVNRNARWLEHHLDRNLNLKVNVIAIVAFPGWIVDAKQAVRMRARVKVIQIDRLQEALDKYSDGVPFDKIEKIADRLEHENRIWFGDPDSPD